LNTPTNMASSFGIHKMPRRSPVSPMNLGIFAILVNSMRNTSPRVLVWRRLNSAYLLHRTMRPSHAYKPSRYVVVAGRVCFVATLARNHRIDTGVTADAAGWGANPPAHG